VSDLHSVTNFISTAHICTYLIQRLAVPSESLLLPTGEFLREIKKFRTMHGSQTRSLPLCIPLQIWIKYKAMHTTTGSETITPCISVNIHYIEKCFATGPTSLWDLRLILRNILLFWHAPFVRYLEKFTLSFM
jgi:hypothetical protein